jgi:hypothetical protein
MAHSILHALDADASQLLRYLQRGGNKSYYTTLDADGHASTIWYDSHAEPPAPPAGTNVYFGVNPCSAIPTTNAAGKPAKPENVRGRVEYIAALNCLYAEFDAKDFGGMVHGFPLGALEHICNLPTDFAPSVTVASGGGYHCYWLLAEPFVLNTPEKREQAVAVQRDWVTFVRGDKAAKDIARVLRVPGTLNYKYEPARPVAFYEQAYNRRYHFQILELELDDWRRTANAPRTPRTARAPRTNAPACHTDGLQAGVAQPSVDFVTISKAAAALARLSTERRDEYTDWLHVGMALKGLGAIGYELWLAWSASSPKYNVGECQDKWQTFRVGTPGGTDITLASLYRYADDDAGEPVSSLDENERRQLDAYKARDVQTQRILAMKAPLAAKAVIVGMLPRLDAKRVLVADKHEHSGSLAVNYGTFADIMNTSKASVARAIDIGEQAGLWRKDAEHKADAAGYDVLAMRLDLQPAYFDAALAEPIEQKPRGGTRAGAGRKPKCADCPPRTRVLRRTEITYVCDGCGQVLDAEPVRVEYLPDDAPTATEFKHETDGMPAAAANVNAQSDEFKHETEYIGGTTTVSCLKKTRAELVPVALAETFDTASAIRLADTYAPADATECRHYKTSLVWTQRGEHAKAAALAANVHDERARAILLHLANRGPTLAPV